MAVDVTVPAGREKAGPVWMTLAVCVVAGFMISLDSTLLLVAMPTMARDFGVTTADMEWVLAGYALTFATFLIIGGRLGDVFGHRRILMVGLSLFGVGSLIAAASQNVPQLIVGEAVIEGLGSALMLPSTLAIMTTAFEGRRRAVAFGAWGATGGVALAFGPVIGGLLTTHASWRWGFGINVIVAPLVMVGTLMAVRPGLGPRRRVKIDAAGAALISAGTFLLVFATSESARYGWWQPLDDFSVGSAVLWPGSIGIAVTPVAVAVGVAVLVGFYLLERYRETSGAEPLVQFTHLRMLSFRYGLLTGTAIMVGHISMQFTLAQFLQTAEDLSAADSGLWMLPFGASVIVGAQVGGRLARRLGAVVVVRVGLAAAVVGSALVLRALSLGTDFRTLTPGLIVYGVGLGFTYGHLIGVALSEVPAETSGVASAAQATARQLGIAVGVAAATALLTTVTARSASGRVGRASLPPGLKAQAAAGIGDLGATYDVPPLASQDDAMTITHAIRHGVLDGSRVTVVFTIACMLVALAFSLRIPRARVQHAHSEVAHC